MTELETIREQRGKLLAALRATHAELLATYEPTDIHLPTRCQACKIIATIEAQIARESKPTPDTHVWAVEGDDEETGEPCWLDELKRTWTMVRGHASLFEQHVAEAKAQENGGGCRAVRFHPAVTRTTEEI
jgi:hypothetical protein